jgi:DNA-binding PadR family transcriptional regulator
MPSTVRLTPATRAVLAALADDPTSWHYGYDLLALARLKSGSLYPILVRLADRGFLEARWEQDPPAGRPARHLYRLTSTGRELARAAAARRVVGSTRPHLRLAEA